jgi:hypothetical protein
MISPSPLQQSPGQPVQEPKPEEKKVALTPIRKRTGQSPGALFVKGIFRPIFKGLYYVLQGIRRHKLVTLCALILFLGGATVANYMVTRTLPFGIGANDPLQSLTIRDKSSSDNVRNWLYALRDGNANTMTRVQQGLIMQQPPDPNQLIGTYSNTHITWQEISVLSVNIEPDTTIDVFVKVNVIVQGQNAAMIWHFATLPQQTGRILTIELVSTRQTLQ